MELVFANRSAVTTMKQILQEQDWRAARDQQSLMAMISIAATLVHLVVDQMCSV